ncbi:MAG: hypothetical protein IPJ39_20970 [Saprospiraceae bacterium]|nr:hypothetical protein [Saprospiraceae bacterium]
MKHILLINALVEILGGFILIFNPHFLLSNPSPELQGVVISKLYGITIFCFGIVSYLLYKNFEFTTLYKQILVDHSFALAIGLYMYGVFQQSLTPHVGATITHIGLAVIFVLIYLKTVKNLKMESQLPELLKNLDINQGR